MTNPIPPSRCAAELLRIYSDENPTPDVEARYALAQHEPPLVEQGPFECWFVSDAGMLVVNALVSEFKDNT